MRFRLAVLSVTAVFAAILLAITLSDIALLPFQLPLLGDIL